MAKRSLLSERRS